MADKNLTVNVKSKFDKSGFDKLNQNIDKTQANLKETTKGVSGLSSALAGGLAGGFAVVAAQMIPFVLNSIKTGAALSNLRAGFAGTSKDLELLRKATANTVSEAGLIALSNQAMDLGISLENQAKLFSLAEDAGDKYGGSLEENFQKIVLATDGSAKGLRAVGVSATEFKKKVEELVKVQGVKLEQLSAEEQLQIRLQAIFELTGTTMDSITNKTVDAADALEQLGLVAETAASSFGEGLVEGFKAVQKEGMNLAPFLDTVRRDMKTFGEDIGSVAASLIEDMGGVSSSLKQMAQDSWTFLEGLVLNSNAPEWLKAMMVTTRTSYNPNIPEGPDIPLSPWSQIQPKQTTTTPRSNISTPGGSTADKVEKVVVSELEKFFSKLLAGFSIENLSIAIQKVRPEFNLQNLTLQIQTLPGDLLTQVSPNFDLEKLSGNIQDLEEEKTFESRMKAGESLANSSNVLLSNIQSVMGILGMETNKFVSSIVSGFNVVLAIMESIKAVNTILNVIPFLATGGIMQSSGLAVVGERGPELVSLPAGARVYNNQDTQRYFNNVNSTPQAVNVYVNANMDGLKFLDTNMPKYFDKRNFKRIN